MKFQIFLGGEWYMLGPSLRMKKNRVPPPLSYRPASETVSLIGSPVKRLLDGVSLMGR